MSERLTQNQRTAVGVALLLAAGAAPVAATLYAAEQRDQQISNFDLPTPETEPTPDRSVYPPYTPAPSPSKSPSPSPTSIEIPTPTVVKAQPIVTSEKPVISPEHSPAPTMDKPREPIMPQPIFKPQPAPTPEADTPTVGIEKPEAATQIISFEAVPAAVSEVMSRDTVYIPAFGCSGSLIRDAQDKPIGYTTSSHCGLILTSDISEKSHNRLVQRPIVGTDGRSYVTFADGLSVKTGNQLDDLTEVGTYSEVLVPSIGDRTMDMAIGAFDGNSIEAVVDAYDANQTPESVIDQLKTGDVLYSSGWPVHQPGNTSSSMKRQEFAEVYLGRLDEQYVTSSITIKNPIITVVNRSKDGAVCSPGKSGSKLFKYDESSDGRPDTYLGTLGGAYFDIDNPEFEEIKKQFEKQFNVSIPDVAGFCMYDPNRPILEDADSPATVVKAVTTVSEIPGYNELYSKEAMIAQVEKNILNPDYKHTVIDGIIQTFEAIEPPIEDEPTVSEPSAEGGGKGGNSQMTNFDRPGILLSDITGAAVIYAVDKTAPNGLRTEYVDSYTQLYIFDRDEVAGVKILQTEGALTTTPTKGNTEGFTDTNYLNFGQLLQDPVVNYDNLYALYYDSYAKQLIAYDPNSTR